MSLKENKLRQEDPAKLLLARATAGKGIVLDGVAAQKVASTLVIESMKVENLVNIGREIQEELTQAEAYIELLEKSLPMRGRKEKIRKMKLKVYGEDAEEEEVPDEE